MRMALYGHTYGNILITMTLLTKEENEAHEKQAAFIAMLWCGLLADPACADNTCVDQNTMLDSYGKGFYGLL